jgi:PKHD-type hydroxylase
MSKFNYWYWKNILNLKQIKQINNFIKNNYDSIEGEELKAKDNNNVSKKNNETFLIKYKKINNFIFDLVEKCYEVNKTNFGYELWKLENNYCNYNVYKSLNKSNYDWHIDTSFEPYCDTKLTVLINLSEKEFEGGDFYLEQTNLMEVSELKEIGSMIMFKSFIRHKVTPVIKGERKNLALFLKGPNFK